MQFHTPMETQEGFFNEQLNAVQEKFLKGDIATVRVI